MALDKNETSSAFSSPHSVSRGGTRDAATCSLGSPPKSLRSGPVTITLRSWAHERLLAWSLVAGLHAFVAVLLLLGLVLHPTPTTEQSLQVTLGGPLGTPAHLPQAKPALVDPDSPQVTEPIVETTADDANTLSGSPDVSKPAEAIAERHEFPRLPDHQGTKREAFVRLLLSITEDGAVSDAQVASTSGSTSLDSFAIAWVKEHWRYRPALRNGVAVNVTTSAVVEFL